MSPVEFYRKMLPDSSALIALEEDESEAIAELIVAIMQLEDSGLDAQFLQRLKASWVELFREADWVARAAFSAHIDGCELRIRRLFEHNGAIKTLLASACSRLRTSSAQTHALQLSMVTALWGGSSQAQLDLLYQIGNRFDLSKSQIDRQLAGMRTAFNTAHPKADIGTTAARRPQSGTPKERHREEVNLSTDSVDMPRR